MLLLVLSLIVVMIALAVKMHRDVDSRENG